MFVSPNSPKFSSSRILHYTIFHKYNDYVTSTHGKFSVENIILLAKRGCIVQKFDGKKSDKVDERSAIC